MPVVYKSPAPKTPKTDSRKSAPSSRLDTAEIVEQEFGHRTQNPLAAFSILPKKVTFETQEIKEKIVLLLRRHWVTNVPWILGSILMVLGPFFISPQEILGFFPYRFQVVTVLIWYMITMAFILESFLSWYFNVYIITDERLVDVDFYSLIYKRISETKIDRIQDVSYNQGGIIQAIFNYGDVFVQTAAEVPEFGLEAVPQPARITKILNQLVLQEEKEKIEGRVS